MENLFIRVNGKMDLKMVMDFILMLVEIIIPDFLKMTLNKARLRKYMLMEPFLREFGRMDSLGLVQ